MAKEETVKKEYLLIKGTKLTMSQFFDSEAKLIPFTYVSLADKEQLQVFEGMEENQKIKVVGYTKGRGFAGSVKRWGFHRGRMTHGWERPRSTGSIGTQGQGRVIPGKKMPGRMGLERKTLKLRFLGIENGQLRFRGSVPGARNSKVIIYVQK